MAGVVQENYCRENNSILNQLKEQGSCRLSGDGRCDSAGHNAKYSTYSFMDQITNRIAVMTITHVTEAKGLKFFKNKWRDTWSNNNSQTFTNQKTHEGKWERYYTSVRYLTF